MTVNIAQSIMNFLMQYSAFKKWYFGFAKVDALNVSLIPIPSPRYIEEWVEGGGYCQYQFAIGIFQNNAQQPYVPKKQTESVDNALDVQAFMEWIEAQDEDGNLPKLGSGLVLDSIQVLQINPNIVGESETTQKMLFSGALYYYEIKE